MTKRAEETIKSIWDYICEVLGETPTESQGFEIGVVLAMKYENYLKTKNRKG